MKFNNDPQAPFVQSAGFYRTQQTWLCVAVLALVAAPYASAGQTKTAPLARQQPGTTEAHGSLISLLRDTAIASFEAAPSPASAASPSAAPEEKERNLVALKGEGGGLDVMEAKEEGIVDKSVHRPWKTRFDLQPFDYDNSKFLTAPENRLSYRHFYAANPRVAEVPNHRDRNAQSDAVLVFGLTAVAAVISAVLIITKLEVLRADELNLVSYQEKMLQVIVCAALPWLLLGAYLLTIFLSFIGNPMRYPSGTYHWQCSAMTWFILLAPGVNLLYFTSHAIWISRICFSVEQQAPMGRMFSLGIMPNDHPGNDAITRITNMFSHSAARQMFLCLEVICAIAGYMLITFRWGANSQYCQPEVYWTTTALCVTVCIIIFFSALAFICSIMIRAFSVSPWMQDFAESFWQADLEAKIARNEAKDAKMTAKAQAKAADDEYDEQFKEWLAYHEEFEEERMRHEESAKEHSEYQQATTEAPPLMMPEDDDAAEVNQVPPLPIGQPSEQDTIDQFNGSPDGAEGFDRTEEWTPFNGAGAAPQPAYNMAGQLPQVANNPFVMTMPFTQPSVPPGTLPRANLPASPGTLPPQFFQGPAPMPPDSVLNASFASMPYGTPPPGYGTPPPGYGFRGPMDSMMSPGSLPGMSPGSMPPGSFGFPGTPGTMPPSYFGPGTLPPGSFLPGTLPPASFMPNDRSAYSDGSSEDSR